MSSSVESEKAPLVSSEKMSAHTSVDIYGQIGRIRQKNGELHISSSSEEDVSISEREDERFRPEKWKTFLAFTFLAANMIWTLTVLAIVHDRMPDKSKNPPLPDVFFDIFPPVEWALDVSELIIIVSVWLTLLMILLHKHRLIILRRCFIIIGLLYFLRSITMFVTQVPVASPTYYCSPKANSTNPFIILKRVVFMLSGFGLSINGRQTFCGDYIYSGHTVMLTLVYLIIREYSPKKFVFLYRLVWLSSCTGVFMVLLSRGHYTVDVVIAYYVTTRVFWIYHTIANNAELKTPGRNNYLSRVWWFSLFVYFEKNVNGVVPRQSEWPLPWPLPWPKWFSRHTRIS